jgi:hypothetical protein
MSGRDARMNRRTSPTVCVRLKRATCDPNWHTDRLMGVSNSYASARLHSNTRAQNMPCPSILSVKCKLRIRRLDDQAHKADFSASLHDWVMRANQQLGLRGVCAGRTMREPSARRSWMEVTSLASSGPSQGTLELAAGAAAAGGAPSRAVLVEGSGSAAAHHNAVMHLSSKRTTDLLRWCSLHNSTPLSTQHQSCFNSRHASLLLCYLRKEHVWQHVVTYHVMVEQLDVELLYQNIGADLRGPCRSRRRPYSEASLGAHSHARGAAG